MINDCAEMNEDDFVSVKAKLFHRKAQAQSMSGDMVACVQTYKDGLSMCPEASDQLGAAARLALDMMPAKWLATLWIDKLSKAEAQNPLSTRDGILLRQVPKSKRLGKDACESLLVSAIKKNDNVADECRNMLINLWSHSKSIGRAECAYIRAITYLEHGDAMQCERDATVALVYGPQDEDRSACWSAAFALRSKSLEIRGENVGAMLDILRALECSQNVQEYEDTRERLLPRIPEHYASAIRSGCGFKGLVRMMETEKERAKPEVFKNRPKYYYYYEWMKRRIEQRHPSISEQVMDKLLTLDATELDLLLQYPQAIDNTVHELESYLNTHGAGQLESYEVPLLTYTQVQELKQASTVQEIAGKSHQLKIQE